MERKLKFGLEVSKFFMWQVYTVETENGNGRGNGNGCDRKCKNHKQEVEVKLEVYRKW